MNTSNLRVALASAALLGGLSLFGIGHAADAGSSDNDLKATPYRPTVSNPADLPVPGHFEWEAGGLVQHGQGDDRHDSVPYLLKYAFDQDFGVLVGGESLISDHSGGDSTHGWGDTSVTMKFHHAVSSSTAVGLEAGAKLPTASHDLGSGHADFTLNGILSTTVNDFDIDLNASYTRLGVTDLGTNRGVVGWAVAASHDLAGQWGAAGELSGSEQSGAPGQAQFLGALSYTATPTLVFDGGALFGLNRNSARYGVFAGVTMLVR